MSGSTDPRGLLPGVRQHGRRFQVRVHPFPAETYATADQANMRAIELRQLRDSGVRDLTRSQAGGWITLADACEQFLARKRAAGGRRGKLTEKGLRHWDDATKPWRTGRHANTPLRVLRRGPIEDAVLERAAEHPVSARNEAQALRAVLRYAQSRGETFEANLLTIDAPAIERHRRPALTVDELEWLMQHTDGRHARLILFAGTVGNRIGELFTLERHRVDLDAMTLHIPAQLCKERRDKTIDLTVEETDLLREQLKLPHVQASRLVFPRVEGARWTYSGFRERVWIPALEQATATWQRQHATTVDPFTGLTLHVLRRTAISLMREIGMPAEYVAQRVGHADGGALLLRTYRHTRRAEVRRALDQLGGGVRHALTASGVADVTPIRSAGGPA